jgi:dihydrofolate synthase/folylpolyglutamate synthase
MNYPETLEYLYTQLPMFTRVGASAFKKDLTNTLALCERLGNPQHKFKTIHVAGTNGKGSTSHMLAAILQMAGYKTGLYTSPHLRDFRERIRINGEMIAEDLVVEFVAQHQSDFDEIQPSFFEMTVALAFDYFAEENVDVAIIEVGLGGRLDSTNVILPVLSIITNIGWDHMNILGNTLPLIAAEKAGIIKPGIPVIISEHQPELSNVFIAKAKQEIAPISFASDLWETITQTHGEDRESLLKDRLHVTLSRRNKSKLGLSVDQDAPIVYQLQLDLSGSYQSKNVTGVITAIHELKKIGFVIKDQHILAALTNVKLLTGLRGRWDILAQHPLVICDTGHNSDGIAEVMKNINSLFYNKLHFVIGMVNDKELNSVLRLLPKEADYYFCKPGIPRGLDAQVLQDQAEIFGLIGEVYSSVASAFSAAKAKALKDDCVFVGGSTFVVAEII